MASTINELAMNHVRFILSDFQLKTLMEKLGVTVRLQGIADEKNVIYFHLKLMVGDRQIADEQVADNSNNGKFNTVGLQVGKTRYISYHISEVRKNLKYSLLKYYAVMQGLIDPEAELFGGEIELIDAGVTEKPSSVGGGNADNACF